MLIFASEFTRANLKFRPVSQPIMSPATPDQTQSNPQSSPSPCLPYWNNKVCNLHRTNMDVQR